MMSMAFYGRELVPYPDTSSRLDLDNNAKELLAQVKKAKADQA